MGERLQCSTSLSVVNVSWLIGLAIILWCTDWRRAILYTRMLISWLGYRRFPPSSKEAQSAPDWKINQHVVRRKPNTHPDCISV